MYTHDFISEHQIIDRYVMDKLSEEERSRFEDHFLSCNECTDALELAQSFREGLKKVAAAEVERVVKTSFMARLLGARMMRTTTALLAAAVFFLAFQPNPDSGQSFGAVAPGQSHTLDMIMRGDEDGERLKKVKPGDMLSQPIEPGLGYRQYRAHLRSEDGTTLNTYAYQGERAILDVPVQWDGPKNTGPYKLVIEGAEPGSNFELYATYPFELEQR